MEKLRIIVGGFLGILPAGGVTWDYVQYPLGFAKLGHDVYYVEDTRLYPIYQTLGSDWNDASSCVAHLQAVMRYFGMEDRWAYRDEASGQCFGMGLSHLKDICATADVFVNVSCATVLREEYLRIPRRVLIDSDPMFTQIQYHTAQSFTPGASTLRQSIEQHNFFFTFGENIGMPDCQIPGDTLNWRPTRQPICLEYWPIQPVSNQASRGINTLMNWAAGKTLHYAGEQWGQKDSEFPKIQSIPHFFPDQHFALVVNQTGNTAAVFPQAELQAAGWMILNPNEVANDWRAYRQFLQDSVAELSIAKATYVKARTGWFSCRSACYLATGRPVIAQDTGWSAYYPSGLGLLAFQNEAEARVAVAEVLADLPRHARQARAIAEDFFDSRRVLSHLLEQLI
jgi:hypothetical protein